MVLRPRFFAFASVVALSSSFAVGCVAEAPVSEDFDESKDSIVVVPHTDVERQSIGNCWIYAHATWIESMRKTETGENYDVSQSYWTYWHWFEQIIGKDRTSNKQYRTVLTGTEVQTGGSWQVANNLVKRYGVVEEKDFVDADTMNEMSYRQSSALAAINRSLTSGALQTEAARADAVLVRTELDKAWSLPADVVAYMNQAFGDADALDFAQVDTGSRANSAGTPIVRAADFKVAYPRYTSRTRTTALQTNRSLRDAMADWRQVSYYGDRRAFQIRAQRALHALAPVIVTWDVDFNALENGQNERRGSFNLTTLTNAGQPGRLGGHMTVFGDYKVKTRLGDLEAGVTLDPNNPEDKAKLDAALEPASEIVFFRIKNSWGGARPDRAFSPGMPGFHDLYMDYLNGPITWCTETEAAKPLAERGCDTTRTPLRNVVLPPGF